MDKKEFHLGGGLSLKLNDCEDVYFGRVNINVWRNLMPSYTLRSGSDSNNGDLWYDDFRNDNDNLDIFLGKLSQRLGRGVYCFKRSDIGSLAYELERKGVNFNNGALYITIFK